MIRVRISLVAAALAALFIHFAPGNPALRSAQAQQGQQEGARPEVGKILQAAQALIQARKYRDALAKLKEVDAIPNHNAYETRFITLLRGNAALNSGDAEGAARVYEPMLPNLAPAERQKIIESIAIGYYNAKDYAKAIEWAQRAQREGSSNGAISSMIVSAQYQSGNFAAVAKEVGAQVTAAEKSGRAPPEDQIVLLANAYQKLGDDAGYASALEKLLLHYPKKEYWGGLLGRIMRKPGFSDRLGLDVYRLQLATGNLDTGAKYFEMAQLALQAGLPGEAKSIIDAGYAAGKLGTGNDAARHQRLKDLALKQIAEDKKSLPQTEAEVAAAREGTGLVNVGHAYATTGAADKGIRLMEQGIERGRLKYPNDALLHLGVVYLQAGQKDRAIATFRRVKGDDGAADLARLWIVHARQS